MDELICKKCGAKNINSASFCQECGENLKDNDSSIKNAKGISNAEINRKFNAKMNELYPDRMQRKKNEEKNKQDKYSNKYLNHLKKSWDAQNERSKFLVFLLIFIVGIGIVGAVASAIGPKATGLTMDNYYPYIGNNTTYILSGTTEANATVHISSYDLKLNDSVINADNSGRFEYFINMPIDINGATVYVTSTVPSKKTGYGTVVIKRTYQNNTPLSANTTSPSSAESESQYKDSCKYISFKELEKNPDKYKYQRVKYSGKVIQIMESYGSTDIRMDVNDNFGDTIYVTYDGTTPAVEDNAITVYGEVIGSYTYISTANYKITLPEIRAKYIDMQ